MGILDTAVNHRAQTYLEARAATLAALAALETALDAAREGGGERAVTRHHARGRLLPRERIELLVDRDSPLLELSPVAGWGTGGPAGAAVVTAIGVVEARPCVIVADDPTVSAGAAGVMNLRKIRRAQQIARQNRLPLVWLAEPPAEPGPAPILPSDRAESFHQAGQVAAGFARLAAAGIPTAGVWFGEAPAGTGEFDYTIALRSPNGGRPVRAWLADRSRGNRPDQLAEDERDALRLARECASRFPVRGAAGAPRIVAPPKHDPEDLLAVPASEPREILGRILDRSTFDEVQPRYGEALCAGWGELHGYPVAVLADATSAGQGGAGGTAAAAAADRAARLVRLATRIGTPLLFLQQGTVPADRIGAAVLTAAAGSGVPVLSVRVGTWRGATAVPALARFRFAWPQAGAELSSAPAPRSALELSGQLDDDGIIDPRDTRTVVGLCLSVMGQ